ncbi:hypothetical protein L1887_57708 [Cichorium endivia]|nr:hypothetical protein L1887_57708 [Cichorium endivia]
MCDGRGGSSARLSEARVCGVCPNLQLGALAIRSPTDAAPPVRIRIRVSLEKQLSLNSQAHAPSKRALVLARSACAPHRLASPRLASRSVLLESVCVRPPARLCPLSSPRLEGGKRWSVPTRTHAFLPPPLSSLTSTNPLSPPRVTLIIMITIIIRIHLFTSG